MGIDETPVDVAGAIALVPGNMAGDDWYTIERTEHSHTRDIRPTSYGAMGLWYSGRISDADVEGTREEILAIATAIIGRDRYSAKRCAVEVSGDIVEFWSPRNSTRRARVSYDAALLFALTATKTLQGVSDDD